MLLSFSIFNFTVIDSEAEDDSDIEELFNLPFDELLKVKIGKGTLVSLEEVKIPASITTITSDQIQQTPFRNIYDLIEVYVPGAFWMNNWDSPTLGIRGVISDRNNKFLVLINSRNANLKARGGAMSELENWNIDDIERIEIIRGPGSVIYGPGAVAGVINIITKNLGTNDYNGLKISTVYPYNSIGGSAKYSNRITDNIDLFSYLSLISTAGYTPDKAFTFFNNNSFGQLGKEIGEPPQDYYKDYNNIPQIKLHLDFNYENNTRLWMRYLNSGANRLGAFQKSRPPIGVDEFGMPVLGDLKDVLSVKNEHFYITLQNQSNITDNLDLQSMISWDSENNARREGYFQPYSASDSLPEDVINQLKDINSLRMKYNNFSESEFLTKFILNGNYSDKFSFAGGAEISYNYWGSPWFEDDRMIRMGDSKNIISDTNSPAYGFPLQHGVDSSIAIFVNDGWSTLTYSIFAEAKYTPVNSLTFLISGRLDKNTYSEFLISPRLSIILGFDKYNYLKLVGQESNRMNTAEELYLQNLSGILSKPEKLRTLELIYTSRINNILSINISMFYNNYDVISWYDPIRSTRITGNLSIAGAEFDVRINSENLDLGFSHTYSKQLKWDLNNNVSTSGISYSDYQFNYLGNELNGIGNDLNNWSNHATKVFLNVKLFQNRLLFHIDSRVFWDFKGAKDGLQYVNQIVENSLKEEKVRAMISYMQKHDLFDMDLRINAQIDYLIFDRLQAGLFLLNIIDATNNYRYQYEAGNKSEDYMIRTNAIVEPFTIGFHLIYKL